jgi:spermidine synthase
MSSSQIRLIQMVNFIIKNCLIFVSFLGPAEALFEESFYSLMKAALKQPHGIICCQGECIWLDLPLIKKLLTISRHLFPSVAYANVSTPTYPCGTLGFVVSGLNEV